MNTFCANFARTKCDCGILMCGCALRHDMHCIRIITSISPVIATEFSIQFRIRIFSMRHEVDEFKCFAELAKNACDSEREKEEGRKTGEEEGGLEKQFAMPHLQRLTFKSTMSKNCCLASPLSVSLTFCWTD